MDYDSHSADVDWSLHSAPFIMYRSNLVLPRSFGGMTLQCRSLWLQRNHSSHS